MVSVLIFKVEVLCSKEGEVLFGFGVSLSTQTASLSELINIFFSLTLTGTIVLESTDRRRMIEVRCLPIPCTRLSSLDLLENCFPYYDVDRVDQQSKSLS